MPWPCENERGRERERQRGRERKRGRERQIKRKRERERERGHEKLLSRGPRFFSEIFQKNRDNRDNRDKGPRKLSRLEVNRELIGTIGEPLFFKWFIDVFGSFYWERPKRGHPRCLGLSRLLSRLISNREIETNPGHNQERERERQTDRQRVGREF